MADTTSELTEPHFRRNDPERTKREIMEAAREEFARHGLTGARVDAIAARTKTAKRMIYYYFGSKEGLYLAVLEAAYDDIRSVERELRLEALAPEQAIRRMVEFTFDYQWDHADFTRLVTIENIHHGQYLRQSRSARALNVTIIDALRSILERGRREGLFRGDVDAIDVHLFISGFCFFRSANRHTIEVLFGKDLGEEALRTRHREMLVQGVLGMLRPPGAGDGDGVGAEGGGSAP